MELSFSQIQALTVGALNVSQTEQGYEFSRFTPAQREAFGAVFDKWAIRSDYTSGIRIDFHTDASGLCVTVGAGGNYEVLVDDLCSYFESLQAGESFRMEFDGTDHRITLVLPNLTRGIIQSVRLEGETYINTHTYRKKAAFYGDSITQGSTAVKSSQCYTWLLTRYFDLHSMNFGVGGTRFQPETVIDVGYDPEVVFIALGTNNYGANKSKELLHTNCPAYFDNIAKLYPSSKIICITPIWRADGEEIKAVGTIHDARAFIHDEAQKRGFTVVDGFTLVPHRKEYYEDLRLHPNDMGFALYAQNLIKTIARYL